MRSKQLMLLAPMLALIAIIVACTAPSGRRRAESTACGNYMCSTCIAARAWAQDGDGHLPSDLLCMSNEVASPRILVCPGDHFRRPATNWASFTPDQSSFEIVTPHLLDGDTNGVFLRCKFHHDHLGYADGTVFDGSTRRTKVH